MHVAKKNLKKKKMKKKAWKIIEKRGNVKRKINVVRKKYLKI